MASAVRTPCVVFDFDGTLVDSNAAKREAFVRIFEGAVPRETVQAVLADSAGMDRYGVIERTLRRAQDAGLLHGARVELVVPGLADAYNSICEEYTATCLEMAGASAVLPQLARRYPVYLVSDTPEEPLRRVVERRGWRPHFRDVLGRPRTKVEHLASIATREAIEPGRMVVVGDSGRDLAAARYHGCRFIGIRSDGNDFDEPALLVLDGLSGLEAVIEALAC